MSKVSTFQPITLHEVNVGRWGSDRKETVIDKKATFKKIQTWLKRKNVVKQISISTYGDKAGVERTLEGYPIELTVVGDSYYSKGSRQFRVYVKEGYKTIRFVQSSKDGVLNMEKLLALVTEMVEKNNAKERGDWENEQKRTGSKSKVAAANKELKGTGFAIDYNEYHDTFKVVAEDKHCFYGGVEEMNRVVAKLITLKK